MFYRTDDPVADAEAYSRDQDRRLSKYPKCAECGEPITDETHIYIGKHYCHDCISDNKVDTDQYMN